MPADSAVDQRGGTSFLDEIHDRAGARFREGTGGELVPHHYGDPGSEYDAAVGSCALTDRSYRARWRLEGRDPARMLDGIVTNTIPSAPESVAPDAGEPDERQGIPGWRLLEGRAPYGLTLTAKGKVVSDHRLPRLPVEDGDAFLLDLPGEGVPGMEAHFDRFLPPRFATVVDESESTGMLSVVGPDAHSSLAAALERTIGGVRASDLVDRLSALDEGGLLLLLPPASHGDGGIANRETGTDGGAAERGYHVFRSGELGSREGGGPVVLDVVGSRSSLRRLWDSLREEGCTPMGRAVWDTLRVEGGRPAFGVDMDEDTIPVEAGVHDRAIDYEKGCYTGQEVIVRIRDRGRVNRHLRRLRLGERPIPEGGTPLFRLDGAREVGRITSAVESPRFGESIALGYVRRELEPPTQVRLGSADGPAVEVRSLDEDGPRVA